MRMLRGPLLRNTPFYRRRYRPHQRSCAHRQHRRDRQARVIPPHPLGYPNRPMMTLPGMVVNAFVSMILLATRYWRSARLQESSIRFVAVAWCPARWRKSAP